MIHGLDVRPLKLSTLLGKRPKTALLDYVKRNWEAEMGTDPPDDPEQMVVEYFDEALEAYDIQEVP